MTMGSVAHPISIIRMAKTQSLRMLDPTLSAKHGKRQSAVKGYRDFKLRQCRSPACQFATRPPLENGKLTQAIFICKLIASSGDERMCNSEGEYEGFVAAFME